LTEGRLWKIGKLARIKRAFVRVAGLNRCPAFKGILNRGGEKTLLETPPKKEKDFSKELEGMCPSNLESVPCFPSVTLRSEATKGPQYWRREKVPSSTN